MLDPRNFHPRGKKLAQKPLGRRRQFFFLKKMLPAPFLMSAETEILVQLSASVLRFGVSRMRDFLFYFLLYILSKTPHNSFLIEETEQKLKKIIYEVNYVNKKDHVNI